jgi:hypothetical protein
MVTLLYHKQLDGKWKEAARALKAHLEAEAMEEGGTLAIIGRARKLKVELDRSFVIEKMQVGRLGGCGWEVVGGCGCGCGWVVVVVVGVVVGG